MRRSRIAILALALAFGQGVYAQQSMTRDQILQMSVDELSELPLEDLMAAVEILGVSSVDELFALVMNKNVSAASKKEESAFASPLSTSVITRQEMRTWGVSTIEEAFRLIPGVVVEEKTNGIYNIYIRGLNNIPDGQRLLYTENNNVLLMVDGRNVTNYMAGGIYTEALPVSIEDVERIEVVRGASSALYGQNAVQGVINIITEKPGSESRLVEGGVQMGNNSTVVADVAFRGKVSDKIGLGLTANAQRRDRKTEEICLANIRNLYHVDNQSAFDAATTLDEKKQYVTALTEPVWVSREGLSEYVELSASQGGFYSIKQDAYEYNELLPDPSRARESYGVNGYLTFTPSQDVKIDLTGGYQHSTSMNSTTEEYKWSHGVRTSKTAYVNLEAAVKGFHLNAGYTQGPVYYAEGVPGFKVRTKQLTANADYDLQFGDLSVRPGMGYMLTRAEDYTPGEWMAKDASKGINHDGQYLCKNGKYVEVSGFFRDHAQFVALSPSVRLDYKLDDWRLIGAYRLDKTDNPDRANHSWQFAVNKELGHKNFVRLSYGRATRSAVLMNSNADYKYDFEGRSLPKYVYVQGASESNLLKIDGVELGWRSRPFDNLLIDAEAFYSYSTDYGSLQSRQSYLSATPANMGYYLGLVAGAFLTDVMSGDQTYPTVTSTLSNTSLSLGKVFDANTVIAYDNLPYKAKQMGASVNVDWIVSPKLIAKFNANVQRTTVDDFFRYSHSKSVQVQIAECITGDRGLVTISKDYGAKVLTYAKYRAGVVTSMGETPNMTQYVTEYLQSMAYAEAGMIAKYGDIAKANPEFVDNVHAAILTEVVAKGLTPGANVDVPVKTGNGDETIMVNSANLIAAYYALKYNVHIDETTGSFVIAGGDAPAPELEKDHLHKATPTFYGMMGVICKPTNELTVSAFANLIGTRTYALSIGECKLPNRATVNLKVGYRPVDNCEIFVNAHNLFNSEKQEYCFFDKIGGLYTVGLNFNF